METSPLREFDEISIQVPWGYIAGRWYGEKNVRPILAMHGWLDNSGTWDTLIPLMPPHIGVLAIDMPGHGKSSRLPAGVMYHTLHYVTDIVRVMQEYNWDKVSFLVHSMSAINSFLFTLLYPDKVDMLIQIDVIHIRIKTPTESIDDLRNNIENFLLEEKRISKQDLDEPPSYSYDELIERMYVGSSRSVDRDKCMHILSNNVTKSTRYPSKYYFSRDPRIKQLIAFSISKETAIFMVKRIKIPHLVIKGSDSFYIDENDPIIDVLRDSNPYFEFHVLQGTHHVHLNNAQETSILVNAFINKWRPLPPPVKETKPGLQSWVERRRNLRRKTAKL